MQAQLPEFGPFFASRKISDPFRIVGAQGQPPPCILRLLQEFTLSLDSRVEFLTTERILVSPSTNNWSPVFPGGDQLFVPHRCISISIPLRPFLILPSVSSLSISSSSFSDPFPISLSLSLFFLPLLYSRPPPPSPSSFHPFTIPLPRSNVDLSNDYFKFNLSRLARGKGEEEKKKKRKEKKGLEGRPQPMTPCVQISLKI